MTPKEPMSTDNFEHFCTILVEFEEARQEAFELAWNEGDIQGMVEICEEFQNQ